MLLLCAILHLFFSIVRGAAPTCPPGEVAVPTANMMWAPELMDGQACFCARDGNCDDTYSFLNTYEGVGVMNGANCEFYSAYYSANYEFMASCTGETAPYGYGDSSGYPVECVCVDCTTTDSEGPIITCPSDITQSTDAGACDAVVTYTAPVGTDNCPGATTALTAGSGSGATFPVGVTTETYQVTDASGNIVDCSFTITAEDNEAPTISAGANVVVGSVATDCEAALTLPTATDNCDATATVTCSPTSPFQSGVSIVTCTSTDLAGNIATSPPFSVTVIDGTDFCATQCQVPLVTCPAPQLAISGSSGEHVCLDITGVSLTAGTNVQNVACDVTITSVASFVVPAAMPTTGYQCDAIVDNTGMLVYFEAIAGAAKVVFVECDIFEVTDDGTRKRETSQFTPTSGALSTSAASANGDPHLMGAHGEKYDFFGVDGGIYNLFSTKQFVINMLLGKEAKNHFIKQVGVCFRGKCEQFGLAGQRNPRGYIQSVTDKFRKVGGHARFPQKTQAIIELDLCQGHRIVLEKKITNRGNRIAYFDVEIEVPGCHDDFDGALGQTYKCKYAGEHKEKFTFNKSMEENFRVKSLTSQFGLYNSTMVAPCQSVESFNTQGKSVSGKAHH